MKKTLYAAVLLCCYVGIANAALNLNMSNSTNPTSIRVNLAYSQCENYTVLTSENLTDNLTICAPGYPKINRTIQFTWPSFGVAALLNYTNPDLNLIVLNTPMPAAISAVSLKPGQSQNYSLSDLVVLKSLSISCLQQTCPVTGLENRHISTTAPYHLSNSVLNLTVDISATTCPACNKINDVLNVDCSSTMTKKYLDQNLTINVKQTSNTTGYCYDPAGLQNGSVKIMLSAGDFVGTSCTLQDLASNHAGDCLNNTIGGYRSSYTQCLGDKQGIKDNMSQNNTLLAVQLGACQSGQSMFLYVFLAIGIFFFLAIVAVVVGRVIMKKNPGR